MACDDEFARVGRLIHDMDADVFQKLLGEAVRVDRLEILEDNLQRLRRVGVLDRRRAEHSVDPDSSGQLLLPKQRN